MKIGYARVSATTTVCPEEGKIKRLFTDKASSILRKRSELDKGLKSL
jgi:hypothetical protein